MAVEITVELINMKMRLNIKLSRRQIGDISHILSEIGLNISYKLFPKEIICMNFQFVFSDKIKENFIKCRLLITKTCLFHIDPLKSHFNPCPAEPGYILPLQTV